MYFEELKQALYLSDEYSIEKLKAARLHEKIIIQTGQRSEFSKKYSLLESLENLEKYGLSSSQLIEPNPPIGLAVKGNDILPEGDSSSIPDYELEEMLKELDVEVEELLNEEKSLNKKRVSKRKDCKSKQPFNERNIDAIEEICKLKPKDSFSQSYKIRYYKTILWHFVDVYRQRAVFDKVNSKEWLEIYNWMVSFGDSAILVFAILEIISSDKRQSTPNRNPLKYIKIYVHSCMQHIKEHLERDIRKSFFSSDDLERFRFYGQVLSFVITIWPKQAQKIFPSEEEAISYMAYYIADGFVSQKQPNPVNAVLFAKRGLKITDYSDRQKAFNVLGFSAIDCGQRQLAYDTFFSWINCCVVGEIKDIVPSDFFQCDNDMLWREKEGKKAIALMKVNFAYVCSIISDTYERNSNRWKVFHNMALDSITEAIELDSENPSYHCTFGSLLSEKAENKESNLLEALKHFKLYCKYNHEPADKLDSLRLYSITLLNILSESFVKQSGMTFLKWANDENTQQYLSDLNTHLDEYCDIPLREDTDDRELIKAQKSRKGWEPYFKLLRIVGEYKGSKDILNLELLLILIRNIADLLMGQLKRWEYNLTDYYTRIDQTDQGISGRRSGVKPIAYYTTLNTLKFVFDELYQEMPNQAPRKIKEGENGKNCLTVTHAKYMNDPHEGLTLLNEFLSYIEKGGDKNILFQADSPISFRESIYNSQFVFLKSFTERIDNLVMWNRYASDYNADGKNSNGCCVKLDAEVFGQLVGSPNSTGYPIKLENIPNDDYSLYRVVYLSRDGTINLNENPGLPHQVVEYYDTLRILIFSLNHYLGELKSTIGDKWDNLVMRVRDFLQNALHIIIFLFKDSDYSDEIESRLIFVRTSNQQDEIRLLPTSPEKLCINPFFQVYFSNIIFGPNVRDQELWTPYLQYQLNKMWRKHPSLSDKPKVHPYAHYSIENSKIHYHT